MTATPHLITEHLDIWSSAVSAKSTAGRGKNGKLDLYGLKKLRELILELAVRGLLVPQDPHDEPASVLLEKIAAEKARLVKEGKIKKQKKLPPIGEDEQPFELPKEWKWLRLRDIGYDWGQKTPDSEFTYIDVGAINKELGIISEPRILQASEAPSRARKIVKQGTVIYSTVRPYLLNIAIIDEDLEPEPIASTAFAIIHPFEGIHPSFIYRYLRSPAFISYVESCQTGIAYPAVNDKQFFSGLIPIPPLAEQHRIVAKVDELMAICDQLEQEQEQSISAHQTLVHTLLAALTSAGEQERFDEAWARIAGHFDILFTTEESIEQLKQTILQLAVMGKLMPQDPNDEPASALLKKIAAEKARLVKEGTIKKQKKLPPIREDEKPFDLPERWEFCRLQEIISISSGTGLTAAKMASDGTIPVYGGNGITGYHDKGNIFKKTLVIGRVGYYCGSIHITPKLAWVTDNAFITTFSEENIYLHYLAWLLKATNLKENENATAQPVISGRKIYPIVVAIPPTNEQYRIVAKVDELMALCDSLKERITESRTTQQHLADAMAEQALG